MEGDAAAMFRGGPARTGWFGHEPTRSRFSPWLFRTGGPIRSSPAVVDGVVYVTSLDGGVYAVEATEGRLLWRFACEGGGVDSSPTVVDGLLYFTSGDRHVYAVDVDSGA